MTYPPVARIPQRHRPVTDDEHIAALFACPLIHDLAAAVAHHERKRRTHPLALHLAWAAMARMHGSGNRLDAELADPGLWEHIVGLYNQGAATHPDGVPIRTPVRVLLADTYRHTRDLLTQPEVLEDLLDAFTEHSVTLAQSCGLLDPNGPGSRTRPHPSRTIYGDGTVVRPLYRPDTDGRHDPDAQQHHRHDGPIWGNNLVTIACRNPQRHARIILAAGRVHDVGHEADTALELIRRVHTHAGDGIHAVVYDGALRGVHHETLMRDLGLIVVNHPHTGRTHRPRTHTLGDWTHTIRGRTCTHTLVARAGSIHDATTDDSGRLHLSDPLPRHQVRRNPSPGGRWRFALGVRVPCARGAFVAWISPHPEPGDPNHGRADQLRLITVDDPHFDTLYGLRNDSESLNRGYKRTLPTDRAASLGWRRQLLDLTNWAILTNTHTWALQASPNSCAAAA